MFSMWFSYMLTSTAAAKSTFKINIDHFFNSIDKLISKTGFPKDIQFFFCGI